MERGLGDFSRRDFQANGAKNCLDGRNLPDFRFGNSFRRAITLWSCHDKGCSLLDSPRIFDGDSTHFFLVASFGSELASAYFTFFVRLRVGLWGVLLD